MPKKDITFKSSYGNVRLLSPYGTEFSYQVYLNDYFQGMIFTREGKWVTNMNENCKFKPNDLNKIVEIIEASEG